MLANNTLGLSQPQSTLQSISKHNAKPLSPLLSGTPSPTTDEITLRHCITTFHSNDNPCSSSAHFSSTARAAAGQSRSPSFRSYIITTSCTASKEPSANRQVEQCIIIQKHQYLQIWRPRKNSENSHRSAENLHRLPRLQLQQSELVQSSPAAFRQLPQAPSSQEYPPQWGETL